MAYGYRRRGGPSRAERSYKPEYLAGIVGGMRAYFAGEVGAGSSSLDALIAGAASAADVVKTPAGHDLGTELGAFLRGVVRRGQIAGWTTDEFGFLVAGSEESLVDAAMNYGGAVVETVTGGLVTPGDEGGIEDTILAGLGL